ncbi:hypothetical protein GCM10020218_086630 [Dactylosporangium vinaceum]
MDAPDVAATAAVLDAHRPDLLPRFSAAVPPARAAVLTRLWGALWREQVIDPARLGGAPPPLFGPPLHRVVADGAAFTDPGTLAAALGLAAGFRVELDNSVANLALAMTAPPSPFGGLAGAEQSIVDGHPLHPCCRTRIGLSTLDVLAYAPEHHPDVRLRVVETDPGRWRTSGVPVPPRFPVHPWQLPRALATGLVTDTGGGDPGPAADVAADPGGPRRACEDGGGGADDQRGADPVGGGGPQRSPGLGAARRADRRYPRARCAGGAVGGDGPRRRRCAAAGAGCGVAGGAAARRGRAAGGAAPPTARTCSRRGSSGSSWR